MEKACVICEAKFQTIPSQAHLRHTCSRRCAAERHRQSVATERTAARPSMEAPPGARWLPLKGGFALVDAADFDRLNAINWHVDRKGYARHSCTGGGAVLLHRVVLGVPADVQVDHEDRNRLNCLRDNLRVSTPKQNARNRGKSHGKRSIFKGVSFKKGACIARIMCDGRSHFLGTFRSEKTAARAYDRAARERFGAYAYFNFPEEQL